MPREKKKFEFGKVTHCQDCECELSKDEIQTAEDYGRDELAYTGNISYYCEGCNEAGYDRQQERAMEDAY